MTYQSLYQNVLEILSDFADKEKFELPDFYKFHELIKNTLYIV